MGLLFYDVESFPCDALVVFKNINNELIAKYWMDESDVYKKVNETIENSILVGYNNYSYDDCILYYMEHERLCNPEIIHNLSNGLITGYKGALHTKHNTLDTFQQISLTYPSLKLIEGNMGKSIIESAIPFNINGRLTEDQKKIVEAYCEYDVENTIEVYKLRQHSYFEPKAELAAMMGNENGVCRYNTTTMIAEILTGGKEIKQWKRSDIPSEFNRWWNMGHMPSDVIALWDEMLNSMASVTGKGKNKTVNAYDCKFVFGMGGLHGAPTKPGRYKNIKLADVGSMYPSIIVKLGALGEATEKYDGIRRERLRIKHTDKVKANALKLILNSTYGLFKNKYSKLYNPYASAVVCMYGQMVLFKLCGMLYDAGYKLININTDGVAFEDTGNGYEDICRKWENEVEGLTLDIDEFDLWIQKDVNNYVAKTGDKVKVKGGEVNKYNQELLFGNNNARITHIALVEKLLNNEMIGKTIQKHLKYPSEFQYILRPGGTFLGTCDRSGELLPQKVNRVFATKPGEHSTLLYKLRPDGGRVLYPDTPENMYLYNGDLSEMDNFRKIIDVDHYINIVEKKLEGWRI